MQLNIQEIDSVSKRVTVDFSASDVASAFAQVYAKIGKQVSLPGVRKGKVPTAHLRKRFSRMLRARLFNCSLRKAGEVYWMKMGSAIQ